ncbi:hypothetical protein LOTGIDRAFT_235539 [Lottia gigantea]|uniref:Actin maturation protease n=1 Tax=Lottia gigantea TaxID=225164 RepID=V3ZUB5_LOTGI|nr:hypothetical protein LOTGIDRAFT_235539 [Lottia gigantea]ESO86175.1 hypothetical protein LOTGIDRAFT_235539 [Lottia gigantea]
MNMSAMLLPPAPPPPPPKLQQTTEYIIEDLIEAGLDNFHLETPIELGQEGYKFFKEFLDRRGRGREENCYLSFGQTVKPIIQKGPQCGMVALAMAAQLMNKPEVSAEKIFITAKMKNFTKQGEIFSAEYISRLAHQVLNCHSEVVEMVNGKKGILQQLLRGSVLLVPYDADRNHGPCKKKGHKAHWALISGFFLMMDMTHLKTLKSNFTADTTHRNLYHCTDIDNIKVCEEELIKATRSILVYGHQGKSKYTGYWFLNDLLDSNANLREIGPERNDSEYVIPTGGITAGLCGKVVGLIKKAN